MKSLRWIPVWSILLFIAVVAILGFVTPEYDHISHTISRLSITRYGWLATANLVQLGIGSFILGLQLMHVVYTRRNHFGLPLFFILATLMLFGIALAPTDHIDYPREILTMSRSGWMHVLAIGVFITLCPATVFTMVNGFASDPNWKALTKLTMAMMLISVILSLLWLICFLMGFSWFLPYRGILQKAIVLWTLGWTLLVAVKAAREQK